MKAEEEGGVDMNAEQIEREKERERDGDKRREREQEKRQRGRRVRLQFVLGSHCASIHPATGESNWTAEGQVGGGRG